MYSKKLRKAINAYYIVSLTNNPTPSPENQMKSEF